ncbi:protein-tyrosine phosphatase-like protein [Vararia minispora EC-137]|uniref:Protein-tyrosine phosphatase-like protein n=1 Tax=Vararia minispora EC-137 TaxID=1314806 RepID=A0ACB8QDN0_9AGAM|nr:protein-tyrosine phosphatase-like protein [Vararia minispora EC-137]
MLAVQQPPSFQPWPQPLQQPDHALENRTVQQPSRPPPIAPTPPSPPALGNLFLSSCPGKKVRLEGPVKGRGGICRDVEADFARIAALGVCCVVCCLDDEELALLGVPWPSYAAAAREARLDVLRLPMPEGLAPGAPQTFDELLSALLERYTLRGVHVLVHCRGGVGRAGLVGCCWALRLGLCGWIPAGVYASRREGEVRAETLGLVERAIGVMRRRRSLKAIETYEQVRFLVEYVEFLRSKEGEA